MSIFLKSERINFLELSGPVQGCTGPVQGCTGPSRAVQGLSRTVQGLLGRFLLFSAQSSCSSISLVAHKSRSFTVPLSTAVTLTRLEAGRPWFGNGTPQEMFLFARNPKLPLGFAHLHGQSVPEALFPWLKWPEGEVDNKSPSSVEIE